MGKKTREKGAKKEKEEKLKKEPVKTTTAAVREARERPTDWHTSRRTHTHERHRRMIMMMMFF